MVRVVYLTRINFFSSKAHVHTISMTCEALSLSTTTSFTLVSTDNSLKSDIDLDKFYVSHGIVNRFKLVSLNSISNIFKNSSNFFIYNLSTFFANFSLSWYVWKNRKNIDCVYFRDHLILPTILFSKFILNKKVFFESHYILSKKLGQKLTEWSVACSDGVIAIAIALKDFYLTFNKNIVVSFCASSDIAKFKTGHDRGYYCNELGFPSNNYYLVYTGNLDMTGNGDSYGVEDMVKALPLLPQDVTMIVVGNKSNTKHPLQYLAETLGVSDRFICIGWVERELVTKYILLSDILLIPKSGARPGNSPTKMFEYLGAGRPIVAADTGPMREVLNSGVNSILVDYTKPDAWANAILKIKNDITYRDLLVSNALNDALLYSWKNRADVISKFINENY